MDITRNWRLKTSRSQLLATRCPATGAILLPQQTGSTTRTDGEIYVFETEPRLSVASQGELDYARAAR